MTYLPDGNYVVLSDLQCPYEDKKVVAAVTRFVYDFRPDGLLCVGDEADSPEVSRWNKNSAGEFSDTFEAGLQRTYDVLLGFSVALGNKPFIMSRSNHSDRLQKYLSKYGPALSRTSWNNFERIMGYGCEPLLENRKAPLPIEYHHKPVAFAKGWVMMHGDESGSNMTAGGTALGLAKKVGASVICGHTHKLGLQHHNVGHSGKITNELIGIEVGNLMDLRQAGYLGFGAANWSQGFAILRIRKGRVHPQLVQITKGRFVVEGQEYP